MKNFSIHQLNQLPETSAVDALVACCGSKSWCDQMAAARPFTGLANLHDIADEKFDSLAREDWLEAFSCHPKIGDLQSLRMKFAGNRDWSKGEQSGVNEADEITIQELADGNEKYESRFGHIFIVCASGKTAAEMLSLLRDRLPNDADVELKVASAEQRKITHLRLDKLFSETSH